MDFQFSLFYKLFFARRIVQLQSNDQITLSKLFHLKFKIVPLIILNLLMLTLPPPIWGTRAVGISTVVPSITR